MDNQFGIFLFGVIVGACGVAAFKIHMLSSWMTEKKKAKREWAALSKELDL